MTLTRLGGEVTAGRFRTERRGAGDGEKVDILFAQVLKFKVIEPQCLSIQAETNNCLAY